MLPASLAPVVEVLSASDLVAVAQCIAIDAAAFPYASAQFGARSASTRVWIARATRGAAVAGFAAGRVGGATLRLDGLAVDSTRRREGIGRLLLRAAVAYARAAGLQAVGLHVSVDNAAAFSLYRAEGFVVARRLPAFYPDVAAFGGRRDAFEMIERLDAARAGARPSG